jgi:hypothetical protein
MPDINDLMARIDCLLNYGETSGCEGLLKDCREALEAFRWRDPAKETPPSMTTNIVKTTRWNTPVLRMKGFGGKWVGLVYGETVTAWMPLPK